MTKDERIAMIHEAVERRKRAVAGRGLAVVTTLRNLHETPVDVGDDETRDEDDDVDHDEDATRRDARTCGTPMGLGSIPTRCPTC